MIRAVVVALLATAFGVGAHAVDGCSTALGDVKPLIAQGDGTRVLFVSRPESVPVGRHFQVHFVVCNGDAVRSDAKVQVDADMPAHRHGMNYRATVSPLAGGVQRADGLMFHMPGTWRVIFDVALDGRTLRATREIEVQ